MVDAVYDGGRFETPGTPQTTSEWPITRPARVGATAKHVAPVIGTLAVVVEPDTDCSPDPRATTT